MTDMTKTEDFLEKKPVKADTVRQFPLIGKFFAKLEGNKVIPQRIKNWTEAGILGVSALILTACADRGGFYVADPGQYTVIPAAQQQVLEAKPVEQVQTVATVTQTPAATQQTVVYVQQPSVLESTVNGIYTGLGVASTALGVAEQGVDIMNKVKLVDASTYATKKRADGYYNSQTINALANLTRAQGQKKQAISYGRAAGTRAQAELNRSNPNKGGRGGFKPGKNPKTNTVKVNQAKRNVSMRAKSVNYR